LNWKNKKVSCAKLLKNGKGEEFLPARVADDTVGCDGSSDVVSGCILDM
jgi:hypothetical protein